MFVLLLTPPGVWGGSDASGYFSHFHSFSGIKELWRAWFKPQVHEKAVVESENQEKWDQPWFCHFLLEWLWTSHLTFLSSIFSLCKMGINWLLNMHQSNVICIKVLCMFQVGYTFKADYCHYYNESIENWHKNRRREKHQWSGNQRAWET